MRVRIRHFQALDDVTFEIEGFTVLTGRTNLGKSAVIRAMAAMLFGLPGESYVAHGAPWVGGSIKDDGLEIVWRKVPTSTRNPNLQPMLKINGVLHTKIGREHQKLTTDLGLVEIETSQDRLRPQIAQQHDLIFLIFHSNTVVAEVFKTLGRVDVITSAQGMAKKDRAGFVSKRKIRVEDLAAVQSQLDDLDFVDEMEARLVLIEKVVEEQIQGILELTDMMDDLIRLHDLAPPAPACQSWTRGSDPAVRVPGVVGRS